MVWIDNEHYNYTAATGSLGGAMCLCTACCAERAKRNHKTPLQRQLATAGNELDKLYAMLEDGAMKEKTLAIHNILAEWEVE